jgi:hypothetical protein
VSRLAPLEPQALAYDKPLCASLDRFTLHAATRAGALDSAGREALLRYVLRPPVAQERVEQRPDGLVRITLKKAYTDGTIAVDMDPLSLLGEWTALVLQAIRGADKLGRRLGRRGGSSPPQRWPRMRSMTAGCVMRAIKRISLPQRRRARRPEQSVPALPTS